MTAQEAAARDKLRSAIRSVYILCTDRYVYVKN